MLKITIEREQHGMIVARWATYEGAGETFQEALSALGKRLDEFRVGFHAALHEDAQSELMGT